ncbi:MAG: para-aminobenzoate synthetase component [Frankiaceae bacterium]|nr:para-aminobenzoate synthetase component [Frankiaceae bacterium]
MLTPPRAPGPRAYAELARWQWWRRDGGDPVALATAFLAGHGFAVDPLGTPARTAPEVAGAAVLLGAAALPADLAGLPAAAPTPCPDVPDAVVVVLAVGPAPPPAAGPARVGEWTATWSRAAHAGAVERVRVAIARGDLYQANLVAHRSAPFAGDPAALSAALAAVPDTPYAGTLAGDGWSVHSASPESFLTIAGDRATVRPIKGTAADPDTLAGSAKDRAEHVMIVDLERNDLGRVAVPGSVEVPALYDVLPRAGVWHAESTVTATLRQGTSLAGVLAATFPGGSVTGAPKRAALDLIHRTEPVGRGPSMGAFGWVSPGGDVDLGLTIRTFAVAGGRIHLWTGGGVTWGSDPAGEVDESEAKAAPLLAALATLSANGG